MSFTNYLLSSNSNNKNINEKKPTFIIRRLDGNGHGFVGISLLARQDNRCTVLNVPSNMTSVIFGFSFVVDPSSINVFRVSFLKFYSQGLDYFYCANGRPPVSKTQS